MRLHGYLELQIEARLASADRKREIVLAETLR
jgi:hypothetical protein